MASRNVNWQFLFDHRPAGSTGTPSSKLGQFPDAQGIIAQGFYQPGMQEALEWFDRRGVRIVVVGEVSPRWPSVVPDESAVGLLAFEHLRSKGLHRTAWIGRRYTSGDVFDERRSAFLDAAVRLGAHPPLIGPDRASDQDDGVRQALREWLSGLAAPIGIYCGNIDLARRVVAACAEAGRRVPSDVAVLGTDPDDLFCEMVSPPLSTIDHGMRRAGFEAAHLLDRLLQGESAPDRPIRVPPVRVQARRSTDTLAVDDAEVRHLLDLLLRRHTDPGLKLSQLIAEVPLSRRALEQRFRKAIGHGIHDELLRLRVNSAQQLLLRGQAVGGVKLAVVAEKSGFSSPARLSEAFTRLTGQRPGEWRKSVMP